MWIDCMLHFILLLPTLTISNPLVTPLFHSIFIVETSTLAGGSLIDIWWSVVE